MERVKKREGVPINLFQDIERVENTLSFKRGVIAFDIVFDQRGKPYIVEIQGSTAAINGLKRILGDRRIPPAVKRYAEDYDNRKTGNPHWFDMVGTDKAEQPSYIPDEARPKTVVNPTDEDIDQLLDDYEMIIIKPADQAEGKGISIFNQQQSPEAKTHNKKIKEGGGEVVAQQFIVPRGATHAPQGKEHHPASMRLIVPFTVKNGEIRFGVEKVGYQRVSAHPLPSEREKNTDYGAGVVNYSRDASPSPLSDKEYDAVKGLVYGVVKNIVTAPEKNRYYCDDFCYELLGKNYLILKKIQKKFPHFSIPSVRAHPKEAFLLVKKQNIALRFVLAIIEVKSKKNGITNIHFDIDDSLEFVTITFEKNNEKREVRCDTKNLSKKDIQNMFSN